MNWPQVRGTIVSSKVSQYCGTKFAEDTPVIEYEFSYEGRSIRSAHWRAGNFSSGIPGSADDITARYPVGSTVTVFVNPKLPSDSVIEPGMTAWSWVLFGLGIVIFALASQPFMQIRPQQ